MTVRDLAKQADCSITHITNLIKANKLKATKANPTAPWKIQHSIPNAVKLVKANSKAITGTKRAVNGTHSTHSSMLESFNQWRAVPTPKRAILIKLSKYSVPELRILAEIVKG